MYHQIVQWLYELERICKEAVVVCLMYYDSINLEGLKTTMINLSQDSNLNRAYLAHKSRAMPLGSPAQSSPLKIDVGSKLLWNIGVHLQDPILTAQKTTARTLVISFSLVQ
jgi:hypothetical protein